MKQIIISGKTDAVITLNKLGIFLHGKIRATVNVCNEEQQNEINSLIRNGFIDVIDPNIQPKVEAKEDTEEIKEDVEENSKEEIKEENSKPKKKGGRPKGSKNKPKNIKEDKMTQERQRVKKAEAKTQEIGSKVTVMSPDGIKQGHMTRSAAADILESENTRASIEAMKKLEEEEENDTILPDTPVDESKLNPNEQRGRKATVYTPEGMKSVDMVNNATPNSKKVDDPFIDREDKENNKKVDFIDKKEDDDKDDAFIEI